MTEPNLRFKHENGSNYPSWNEIPLGELVTDNLDPVPTPREGYRRVGIYCHAKGTFQEDVPAENILDVDTMYRIHKDNLIVNITFAWEHAVAIVKPEDEGLLVSHRFPEYYFNDGQVPGFYKYLILRPYFKNQLSLASPGGAGRNRVLNKSQFKEIIVKVPCEEEQQKIADFLSSVDEVIAASEQEVANLETQKKAVMKKIFSQEVRFKKDGMDFPEWEEKQMKEVITLLSGQDFPPEQYNDQGIGTPYLTGASCIINDKTTAVRWTETPKNIVVLGDIVIVCKGSGSGTVAIVNQEKAHIARQFMSIRPNQQLVKSYCYYQVCGMTEEIRSEARGTIPGIERNTILRRTIRVPCLEEQRLIADFLSNFDEAIAAAKKELELWKELKKGLLQQMFV